ncbi:hypothetical protein HK104_006325 [Borealophlyctis nickersoniae]|nr:hypothetical protein HK104_006325 [Borealophlyctis nickersoniae]
MADEKRKRLAFAICDYLQQSITNGTIKEDDAEGIEVAVQCIGEAFGIDLTDDSQQQQYSIKPATLPSIFDIFLATQKKVKGDAKADGTKSEGAVQQPDAEKKAKAEELKGQGNKAMGAKNYSEAIRLYTEALELDPQNALYYGNRAAAHSQAGDHDKAVADAKKALEADPDYAKGYSRLGHAYFCLGKHQEAVDAYQSGLRLEPTNEVFRTSLSRAEAKLKDSNKPAAPRSAGGPGASAGAGAGGMPGLGNMDFASMLNNPNFMQMAHIDRNDPRAQNLMSNPAALQNLMNNPDLARQVGDMKLPEGEQ